MTADESKREVFQVPPSDGKGMTIRRIREIHEAEKAGKPLKLSAEEQEQYLAANKSVVKAARRLVGDGSQFESVSKKLNAILESGVVAKPNFAEQLARLPMPTVPRIPDLDVRPMSRLSQVEIDQAATNTENIKTTASAMAEMVEIMRQQGVDAAKRDQEAKDTAAKNFRLAAWTLVAAVAAIVVPLLPEIVKAIGSWLGIG